MGVVPVAHYKSRNVTLYRQGGINYVLNTEPASHAHAFIKAHGPCAPAMGWRVVDAQHALKRAPDLGAKEYSGPGKVLDSRRFTGSAEAFCISSTDMMKPAAPGTRNMSG